MGLFNNLLLIASYAVIAFAVAVVLPTISPDTTGTNAGVIGLMVFIAGTQLHILYTRRVEREQTLTRLKGLNEFETRCEDQLRALEEDFAELEDVLGDDPHAKNSALVAEMMVVREMLESVLDKSGRKRSNANKVIDRKEKGLTSEVAQSESEIPEAVGISSSRRQ